MLLHDKVALITGGGGGIGRATALLFAREGADVVLASEVPADLEKVATEVRALGRTALPILTDLCEESQIVAMANQALGALGRVDALINCAGVAIHGAVADLSTRDWDTNFAVNIRGMFLVTRALLPQFIARRSGAIVNVSSRLGKEGSALRAAYSASKYAVIGFTKSLALEMKPHNVRVNAICPGPVATPLRARNYPTEDPTALTQPEEVARVILYLSSDDSSGVSGADLDVAWRGVDMLPTVPHR
jgi:NAD(P)-dependent dehydrogenase (short-subunit alcohol dehydrogenase family)